MSNLYSFTPATDDLDAFFREAINLAMTIKNDPVNRAHATPLLGLSGSVSAAVDGVPDIGPFGASGDAPPATIDECCERIVEICETHRRAVDGGPYSGGLWLSLLAPVLVRLIDLLVDRIQQ